MFVGCGWVGDGTRKVDGEHVHDAVDVLALLSLPFFASVKYAGFLLEILSDAALPVVRGSHL